jgi:hypothetical protein
MTRYSDWPGWLRVMVLAPHGVLASVMCWVWWPKSDKEMAAVWNSSGLFVDVFYGHAFCVWHVSISPMLGVNATTDSCRFNESRTGAEHWVGGSEGFAHPELSKTHTRTSGVSQRKLTRTIFDN